MTTIVVIRNRDGLHDGVFDLDTQIEFGSYEIDFTLSDDQCPVCKNDGIRDICDECGYQPEQQYEYEYDDLVRLLKKKLDKDREKHDHSIASEILTKLGGIQNLYAIVGARDFTVVSNGVRFRFNGTSANAVVIKKDVVYGTYSFDAFFVRDGASSMPEKRGAYVLVKSENIIDIFSDITGKKIPEEY